MPGRVGEFGRAERSVQARADLRDDAGPVVFEKDPGSVACPGFIPPTITFRRCLSPHQMADWWDLVAIVILLL